MRFTKDNPESRTFMVTITRATERIDGSYALSAATDERRVKEHLTSSSSFNSNAKVEVVEMAMSDQEELL